MHLRRTIVIALTLALFSGQTFVAVQRAACAMPRGGNPPSCAGCAGQNSLTVTSLVADRSCCGAAKAAADREPARIAPHRSIETRLPMVAPLPVSTPLVASATPRAIHAFETPPPRPSPLLLRTTILRI